MQDPVEPWGLSGCRQGFVGRKEPGSFAFQVPLGLPLKNHLLLRTSQGIIFPRGALYASLYWVTFSPSPVKCFIRAVAGLLVCTLEHEVFTAGCGLLLARTRCSWIS